jgi:hypothetical protein
MTEKPLSIEFRELPTYGVLLAEVPSEIMAVVNRDVTRMLQGKFQNEFDYRNLLLGHMSAEYGMHDIIPEIEPYLLYLANRYDENWKYFQELDEQFNVTVPKQLRLTDLWCNFQKKHEFNPVHTHTGILSFVIWVKIPYDLEEEKKVFPVVSNSDPRTSKFTFHYNNILGQLRNYSLNIDKTFEGHIAMFPSHLNHSVNPFYTSDDFRISVAGNLRLI